MSFPYTLPEGASLECTYSQALPNGQSRTNTATVSWGTDGTTFPNTASAEKAFSFTTPTTVVDGSVTVADPSATPTQAISGISPEGVISQTYFFERWVRFETCGEYQVENTATFTTNTTRTQGSASATVAVSVPCQGGCTLTQGYWKTHSRYGPAPYDSTWAQIGEDTPFYLSGQSYYRVLWTSPSGGQRLLYPGPPVHRRQAEPPQGSLLHPGGGCGPGLGARVLPGLQAQRYLEQDPG